MKSLHAVPTQTSEKLSKSSPSVRLGVPLRVLGFLALVIYAAALTIFIRFLLRNILIILALFLTTALLSYAVWLVFSGRGKRKWLGYAIFTICAILLAVEIVYILFEISSVWALATFIFLLAAYTLLINGLREKYWQEARQVAASALNAAHFKKPYLIINPRSGNGRAMKTHIENLAKEQGIAVIILRKGDDVEHAARRATKAGADVLGISGGDGSIGAVVKVALEHKLPVVVLPGGTRCHFARDIGLSPERIVDALAGFQGVERRIDVGEINGRIFLNNVSFGLYADIIDNPEYREHKVDTARNVLQAIASGEKQPYDLKFNHGSQHYSHAVQVLVGVNSYQITNIFELGRRESLDAGQLQVTVIDRLDDATVRHLLGTMGIATISHRSNVSGIEQWETHTFQISNTRDKMVVGVDGEREEYTTPVNVRILPKVLRVFVPAEGERSRPKLVLSWDVASRIWQEVHPKRTKHVI